MPYLLPKRHRNAIDMPKTRVYYLSGKESRTQKGRCKNIGLFYFSGHDKREKMKILGFDIGKLLGLTITPRKPKEWSQDFVEEVKVKDGVIFREDQRGQMHYIKILEFSAVNFMIMSPDEQDLLVLRYMESLRVLPSKFHIKIVTTQTNIDEYIVAARKALEQEKNEKCREMIGNYINHLVREASPQTFRKHYYYIFEYEPPLYGDPASTEIEIIESLNKKAMEVINSFRALGNEVVVAQGEDIDVHLANLIYNHYNKLICKNESFKTRSHRIVADIRKINGLSDSDPLPDVDFKTLFAPKNIDFNESPDYMLMGGLYKSHFFIPGAGIPNTVYTSGGWLTALSNFGENFDLDLYFQKGDRSEKLGKLRGKLQSKSYEAERTDADSMSANEKMGAYTDAMFLRDALQSNGEDIYEMSVVLSTYATTLKELKERKAFIKKKSIEMSVSILECKRFQEEAFYTTGFGVDLTPKMFNLTHRNITSSAVAATYPFTAFLLRDPEGIALGYNLSNRSLIMLDPFDKHYSNANFCIYGAPGRGKSFALMTITSRLRCHGIQQFILAPEKQHEFIPICHEFGGEFIDISPSSKQRINLFDIRPKDSPELSLIGDGTYVEKSWLIEKVESIKIFMNYLIPDLTLAEKVQIETIALEMYSDFGITADNNSIYMEDGSGRLKTMPIMSDFYSRIGKSRELRPDITIILSQFITGAARSMNGHTNVDLDNLYLVFGLENIKGDLLAPSMFIILDYVWGKCREDRTKKKMIAIDELWKLLDVRNPLTGEFVVEIFKLIRGYGGGAMCATQSVVDLFRGGNNFGNTILSCANSKILLGMERKDLTLISEELGLTANEISNITSYRKGQCLLCAGSNHIPVQISASQMEADLFETERSANARKLEEAKRRIEKERESNGQTT